MPYLLYPSDSTEATMPTYAVGHPDPIDKIILQDLQKWGWRVDEATNDDPKWLTAKQGYCGHMQGQAENDGANRPSLWEYWRDENARRVALEVSTTRKRGKLVKQQRPDTASSNRSSFSNIIKRRESQKLSPTGEPPKAETQADSMMTGVNYERRTIGQIRRRVTQKKVLGDWNRPEPASSLGRLNLNGHEINKYENGNESSAESNAQLDHEITQEVADWVGIGGILKTSQVSVTSEEGICVDDKGERVYFPPKWNLPLFLWEEEVSQTSPTKSKDSSAKGSLECVLGDYSAVFDVADRYQEKDEPDQKAHSIE